MYKNYIFDLYGTLVDIWTDEEQPYLWEKMSEIYRAYGAEYKPEELKEAFRRLEREELLRQRVEYAEIDLTGIFLSLYNRKQVVCSAELARMTAVVFRTLSRKRLQLYNGVTELLETLRERGMGVYLLSNAQSDFTRPELSMLGLTRLFDGIFISSEHGVKKPSPVYFGKLLQTYGLRREECVMIGNDEESDIAGARAAGISGCLVTDGDFGKILTLMNAPDR